MLVIVFLWVLVFIAVGSVHLVQCFHRHGSEILRQVVGSFQPVALRTERDLAKVTQPDGGWAKSVTQGSFLPGKSSIFKTTCCSYPVRAELWCDLASGGFVRSSFLFQRVVAWGSVVLAGVALTGSYTLGLCRSGKKKNSARSWKLLSACSKDEKHGYVSWPWINSQALESRREVRALRRPGSAFVLRNLSDCSAISFWNVHPRPLPSLLGQCPLSICGTSFLVRFTPPGNQSVSTWEEEQIG